MSKERLEKAKDLIIEMMDWIDYVSVLDPEDRYLGNYIIKQAERVQELESHITKMVVARYKDSEELDDIHKQNKRYRELINNINEKASLFGVDVPVYEAIQDAIKASEGDPHESS